MAEALPVVEKITQDIVDTLLRVTAANGCAVTLSHVTRPDKFGLDPDGNSIVIDNGVAVIEGDPTDLPESAQDAKGWIQPYQLAVFVFESEVSDYPARKRLQIIRAEITKALMGTADAPKYNRGGNAIDTIMGIPNWLDASVQANALDGMLINFDVQYYEGLNDPYQSRA